MDNYKNERIEWTRVWREDSETDTPRVLLIGDSIVDGSKHCIYDRLKKDGLTSSAYITSKGINHPFYFREIEMVCAQEDYNYKAVYLQYGGHSGLQSREDCRRNYENLLVDLSKMLPGTPIIVSPFTPWTKGNGKEGEHDTPVTSRVEFTENNKFITDLREDILDIIEKNELDVDLHFFDAYELMLGHNEKKCPDGVHYLPEGYYVLGTAIAEKILEVLNNTNKGE